MTTDDIVARLRAAGCVYAVEEAALLREAAGDDIGALERLLLARMAGEPLEPLVGWVEFGGLRLAVGPGVFVPRVRTELLAETALTKLNRVPPAESDLTGGRVTDGMVTGGRVTDREITGSPVIVELCCGVATVAAVLQRTGRVRELFATDIDPLAIGYARRNLVEPAFALVGDLYDPLPATLRGRVDLIVANAPYVPTAAIPLMPREARDHEPVAALDGGPDGLDVHRRIIAEAPSWLRTGGFLMIETGRDQSSIAAGEMRLRGLAPEVVVDEVRGATVVMGVLAGPAPPKPTQPPGIHVEC